MAVSGVAMASKTGAEPRPFDPRPRGARLWTRYALFAAIATAVNLAGQWIAFTSYAALDPARSELTAMAEVPFAMVVGTMAGLVAKYVLDRTWIFYDPGRGARDHGQKFALYTVMGLGTTLLFWATELLFAVIFEDRAMTYLGAVLGLAMGYVVKYQLDRRYVFGTPS